MGTSSAGPAAEAEAKVQAGPRLEIMGRMLPARPAGPEGLEPLVEMVVVEEAHGPPPGNLALSQEEEEEEEEETREPVLPEG